MSLKVLYPIKKSNNKHKVNNKNFKNSNFSSKSTTSTAKEEYTFIYPDEYKNDIYIEINSKYTFGGENERNFDNQLKKKWADKEGNFNETYIKKKNKQFNKKIFPIKLIKYYKEDGDMELFKYYKESQININIFEDKVKIESSEEDFRSDEGTIEHGCEKVERDLKEAFQYIDKNKLDSFFNIQKFLRHKSKKIKNRYLCFLHGLPL